MFPWRHINQSHRVFLVTNSASLYQPGHQQRSRAWLRPPNDATWLRIPRICVECGWVSTVWDIYPRSPSILVKTVTPCRVISYHNYNQVSCNIIIILYNPYMFLSHDRQPRYLRLFTTLTAWKEWMTPDLHRWISECSNSILISHPQQTVPILPSFRMVSRDLWTLQHDVSIPWGESLLDLKTRLPFPLGGWHMHPFLDTFFRWNVKMEAISTKHRPWSSFWGRCLHLAPKRRSQF